MKIKLINREALDFQIATKQPSFWIVFLIAVGFLFLLQGATFEFLPRSWVSTKSGWHTFSICWLVGNLLIWLIPALYFKCSFPEALYYPTAINKKEKRGIEILIVILAALFLAKYAIATWKLHSAVLALLRNADGHRDFIHQTLIKMHTIVWTSMPYGTDLFGVVLGCVAVLVFPIFEELFYRGYMLNRLCQLYHPITAIIVSAFCFALAHTSTVAFDQIQHIFTMGIFCGVVRIYSGQWQDALNFHLLINVGILVPKVYIALTRFLIVP